MSKINMKQIGFTDRFIAEANMYENLYIGRVTSQYKDLYKIMSENGEMLAEVSGKFRFETKIPSEFPVVGDFVMVDRSTSESGNGIIHHVLSRKSAFIRKAAGTSNEEQVVVSNIDIVFICMSLNNDFSLRRLERYLSIGWDSGAVPVIVLTKADLCDNIEQKVYEVESVSAGADVLTTSAMEENGYLQILNYIKESQTVVFIGSSGVGKTTLINRLMGEDILETKGLRNDDKGKHTTTNRELVVLQSGGIVIDTPGMREIGLESANLEKTFSEIAELASMCKFNDCTHVNEPGCAVQKAISEGNLSEERLQSYKKLKKETKYEGLNSKQIETMKLNEMFSEVGGMKNARKFTKGKNKKK